MALLAGVLLASICPSAKAAEAMAAIPPEGLTLHYDVLRDGDKIGDHEFVFKRSGDTVDVQVKTDVRVKLGFITLYKFWHDATERWVGGKLVDLASKTDDDGTKHELKVSAAEGALKILHDGKPLPPVAGDTIPASLWHRGILGVPATLNTIDGSMMAIKTAQEGSEAVPAVSGTKLAAHYLISGDLARELWFAEDGSLAKVRFKAQDKSDIQYVLAPAP